MNLILKAKYIIFAVLFIVFLLVGTKYGWLVQRYTFSKALVSNPIGANAALKNDLNRCIRTCSKKDQDFAHRTLEILNGVDDDEKNLPAKIAEIRPILLQAIQNYEQTADVKSAVEVYKSALSLQARENLKQSADPQFNETVYQGVEVLAGKFPRNGHAYELLGMARMQKNPRDETAIAAFKKCLTILPTERSCQLGYDQAVRAYTAPYCAGAQLSADLKVQSDDAQFVLVASELSDAQLFSQNVEKEPVYLNLTKEGFKKFQEKFLPVDGKTLSLFLGEENLGTVQVAQASPAAVTFKTTQPGLFPRLCPQPKSDVLPKGLQL